MSGAIARQASAAPPAVGLTWPDMQGAMSRSAHGLSAGLLFLTLTIASPHRVDHDYRLADVVKGETKLRDLRGTKLRSDAWLQRFYQVRWSSSIAAEYMNLTREKNDYSTLCDKIVRRRGRRGEAAARPFTSATSAEAREAANEATATPPRPARPARPTTSAAQSRKRARSSHAAIVESKKPPNDTVVVHLRLGDVADRSRNGSALFESGGGWPPEWRMVKGRRYYMDAVARLPPSVKRALLVGSVAHSDLHDHTGSESYREVVAHFFEGRGYAVQTRWDSGQPDADFVFTDLPGR